VVYPTMQILPKRIAWHVNTVGSKKRAKSVLELNLEMLKACDEHGRVCSTGHHALHMSTPE